MITYVAIKIIHYLAMSKIATVTQKHTKMTETVNIMEQKLELVETECNQ